ncbi:MAG: hypothetical protein KDK66_06070 [Deltaproteobacteria bacterium]|nr:hypothetical protein [Deltaproteobacteria bacterium]
MDIKKLLLSLNAHKVLYVIIGAASFPVHGYDRATQDVDIFIKPTRENAEAAYKALQDFGYDVQDLKVKDLLEKKYFLGSIY